MMLWNDRRALCACTRPADPGSERPERIEDGTQKASAAHVRASAQAGRSFVLGCIRLDKRAPPELFEDPGSCDRTSPPGAPPQRPSRVNPSWRAPNPSQSQDKGNKIREMGGAPRNPAPRNHFLVGIVKPSGCHCVDAFGGKTYRRVPTPLRSTSTFLRFTPSPKEETRPRGPPPAALFCSTARSLTQVRRSPLHLHQRNRSPRPQLEPQITSLEKCNIN